MRSVRLAKEVPGVKKIVANDISKSAVEAIERNITHNNVESIVTANEDDARFVICATVACLKNDVYLLSIDSLYMHKLKGRENQFDVIDLDPYGSATPFLDAAVQAVKPQGQYKFDTLV